MKKIILTITSLSYLVCFGQNYSNTTDAPYNVIPPAPESFYKSQFGNTDINDFRGEPMVNIPLFSINHGGIPFGLDLKYIKAGVKVNDIPNSTGINWVLNTGGIITRTIHDIADEKVVRELFPQLPSINMATPGEWGTYVLQNKDHQADLFNFTVGNYSGSFFLDQNFQPVILTKDNNCKVEVVGSFSQNYQFKITTNDGTVYHFGGTGFTEKTFNKEQASTAGVTSFYLKEITSSRTFETIKFEYEDVGVLRSVPTDIVESYNSAITVVEEPNCGGHPTPSSDIQQTNVFLKISDPKRLKKILLDDKIISFDYSDDYVLYNKLNSINVKINNTLVKKFGFSYLDKLNFNNSKVLRYFLTGIKFYENNDPNVTQEYSMDYNNPLELPDRMSKEIDYLGYYNGKTNSLQTLIPNTNLFDNTNVPAFNTFADRRPFSELAKYGSLVSITYPTKGKTFFEYEPIAEAPKDDTASLYINTTHRTDTKDLFPYEYLGGGIQYNFQLYSMDQNISNPVMKARAVFKVLDELNNVVYTSQKLAISKATVDLHASTEGNLTLDPTKKYKFLLEILDNLCSNCEGDVSIKLKKLNEENGPGVRLKRQYDIDENGIVNVKRVYYTGYADIPDIRKNNRFFVPDFKSYFLMQSLTPNPNTATNCHDGTVSYAGSSSMVENIKSTPYLSSMENSGALDPDDNSYFNLSDPMYSNITLSFGGDNFERGGEEKKYYIKKRVGIEFDLFVPHFNQLGTDQAFIKTEGNLSALSESVKKRFHRSYSFSNVDGKLLSDKIFKVQNNAVSYLKTTENKYIFSEVKKVHNILGTDVYPTSTGGPYQLKNKLISSYPMMVDEVLLSETTTIDFPNPSNPATAIAKNIKNSYLNPDNQLSKQTVELPGGNIIETSYQYAYEKNNQKLIEANMINIPLETKVIEKISSTDAGKMISRSETIYPDQSNYPTAQARYLLLPLSAVAYNVKDNSPSTEMTYDWYDEKGNVLQYTTKGGVPVTIVWGYNKTQPILKIEGVDYRKSLGFPGLADLIAASDKDADPAKFNLSPENTESTLITKLDQFRNNTELADYMVTAYTYDPLIGVRSITPPSGIREVYMYDTANRLKEVRENSAVGKIIKEYKYNYKN